MVRGGNLDKNPVGDPAVARGGVEVEVAIIIVGRPPHLPHQLPVLPIDGCGEEAGLGRVTLQVVDGHIAIVEASHQHVGVVRVDVHAHDPTCGPALVLREGWVLQRKQGDHTRLLLLVQIICG